MPSTTIRMPQLGESVVEGTIGKWLVRVGQRVAKDEPVVEILTDKADSEIPSPEAGIVTKLLAQEGEVVTVGASLCEIDPAGTTSAGAEPAAPPPPRSAPVPPPPRSQSVPPPASAASSASSASSSSSSGNGSARSSVPPAAAPSVRKLAREQGVDLGQLAGSGEGGRVTRDDVLRAAAPASPTSAGTTSATSVSHDAPVERPQPPSGGGAGPARPGSGGLGAFKLPPYIARPGDEVVPMSRRRRIIADHMVFSKLSAPHIVTFAECDLHKTDKLRRENKDRAKAEGVNLTMLAFVAAATTRALREHRKMNARMLDDAYVLLKDIHLGIAVDTPEGLVVPVVRNADELTVRGLARAIDALAVKARDGNLSPDDLAAKTFTISNPGRLGNLVGGAIISQPNVGILRTGEIKKRVVVVEHEGEDLMAIHPVMHMALSYDHRIVDGVAANGFLHRIVELLETGDFSL
jgi:2-oxoglutarate dehydrogenase E2 component (dihydrolipoamide succinyltransferase)